MNKNNGKGAEFARRQAEEITKLGFSEQEAWAIIRPAGPTNALKAAKLALAAKKRFGEPVMRIFKGAVVVLEIIAGGEKTKREQKP